QGGGVPGHRTARRDVLENAAHDLAGPSFRQCVDQGNLIGASKFPDFLPDMLTEMGPCRCVRGKSWLQRHEHDERLPLEIVGPPDRSRFGYCLVSHQAAFDFCRADAMT